MALKRYMFVEDFPLSEGEEEGIQYSPQLKSVGGFGKRLLHQIAKCEYEEHEYEGYKWVSIKKGETGGWIESYENLVQEGDCWVAANGIACMNAVVSGNARIEGGMVGDYAHVSGDAVVRDSAVVKEHGKVYGSAVISGSAVIGGDAAVSAVVEGNSEIGGSAVVIGHFSIPYLEKDMNDEYPALIQNSKIDGRSRVLGIFSIIDSELHDTAYVFGRQFGSDALNYDKGTYLQECKVYGTSFLSGMFIGPLELRDCSVKTGIGEYHGDIVNYIRDKVDRLTIAEYGR